MDENPSYISPLSSLYSHLPFSSFFTFFSLRRRRRRKKLIQCTSVFAFTHLFIFDGSRSIWEEALQLSVDRLPILLSLFLFHSFSNVWLWEYTFFISFCCVHTNTRKNTRSVLASVSSYSNFPFLGKRVEKNVSRMKM